MKEKFFIKEKSSKEFLKQGGQTILSENMRNIVREFHGSTLEKVDRIFKLIPFKIKKFDEDLFRKRTAEQIIESGFITGCTDSGIVFVSLARGCGIPAKYVETIEKEWLENGGEESGHIYSQVYDDLTKKWIWIDPEFRTINSSPDEKGRIIFKEGLDSWDIGIKDYQSLKNAFDKFRKKWLVENG